MNVRRLDRALARLIPSFNWGCAGYTFRMSSKKHRKQQCKKRKNTPSAQDTPVTTVQTQSQDGSRREFLGSVVSGVVGSVVTELIHHRGSPVAIVEPIKVNVSDQIALKDSIGVQMIRVGGFPSSFVAGIPTIVQGPSPDDQV